MALYENSFLCIVLFAVSAAAQTPPSSAAPAKASVSLISYKDAEAGVSFQYPSDWKQVRTTSGFSPPFLFGDATPASAIFEFTGSGNSYGKTRLESLDFLYGRVEAGSLEACRKLADIGDEEAKKPVSQTIHGATFTHGSGGEGSTGHYILVEVYSTFRGGVCQVFEEDLTYTMLDLPGKRNLTISERHTLQHRLDLIMQSVTFAPTP